MALTTPPKADNALLAFSLNFKTLIQAAPTDYGLTAPLATAYGALHDLFATDLAACEPSIRTKSAVVAKNQSRQNLVDNFKLLANLINGTATVSDAQKTELGMNVRAKPSINPPPASWPIVVVKSSSGVMVTVVLKDGESGSSRGRPPGVFGASVFSFIGPTAPADIASWKFEANTGKNEFTVAFPPETAPGTKVWLTAFYFNGSKQSGPACPPVSTNLPAGSVSMAA